MINNDPVYNRQSCRGTSVDEARYTPEGLEVPGIFFRDTKPKLTRRIE